VSIISDFWGSIRAGDFYHDILVRPVKKAWLYFIVLIIISAIILALYSGFNISGLLAELEDFYLSHNKVVEFVNGEIVNMPHSHKSLRYDNLIIEVDRSYIGTDSLPADSWPGDSSALFIGPKSCFLIRTSIVREIPYPATFTQKLDSAYLDSLKTKITIASFLGGFIGWLIIKFIEGMLYIALIIAPILLFKFRRMGLTYTEGFKTGLYLITYQIVLSTLLLVIGFTQIWFHLLFILFYIILIGGFVNIDLTHSKRQLYGNATTE
jgi:hypothetical protein